MERPRSRVGSTRAIVSVIFKKSPRARCIYTSGKEFDQECAREHLLTAICCLPVRWQASMHLPDRYSPAATRILRKLLSTFYKRLRYSRNWLREGREMFGAVQFNVWWFMARLITVGLCLVGDFGIKIGWCHLGASVGFIKLSIFSKINFKLKDQDNYIFVYKTCEYQRL